ncbi:MAG TPA: MerR family transcriptional regulator [Fimbriimonadales bacterium]|jgi:MerR family transcriptional regulator/heat shock protein HspR|nr:MerR family transcriptional regulator [Fimbriimonadales bacterium]
MNGGHRENEPVYTISIAARLCGVHPQTLRTYERQGLIAPARQNEKNRLYSDEDVVRVRQITRLTQDLGVNLAGVEVILNLLDRMEEMRRELETQFSDFAAEARRRIDDLLKASNMPVRRDESALPVLLFLDSERKKR